MTWTTVNAVLAGIGIAILGASTIPMVAHAEEPPAGDVTREAAETPDEAPATVWDKTKEVSGDAWDATREGSAKAWDKTKEVSGDAWDATKEGSAKAWDKTKEVSGNAWDATRDMVQDEPETEPAAETGAVQQSPAATSESP